MPIGKGEVLTSGRDVCLVALGSMVQPAREAATLLAKAGLQACVVNLRFLKPLPEEMLHWASRSHRLVVTLEENSTIGGLGGAVLEWAARAFPESETRILPLGLPDRFIEHGSRSELLAAVGLQAELICDQVLKALGQGENKRRTQSAS